MAHSACNTTPCNTGNVHRNWSLAENTTGNTTTPLTDEEEQRVRAVLFSELGNTIADQGWVSFPAYTMEGRRRLVAVAHRLTAHWGQQVRVEAEDHTRVRLSLAGHEVPREPSTARP